MVCIRDLKTLFVFKKTISNRNSKVIILVIVLFHYYYFSCRKLQWIRLSSKTPFTYIPAQSMTDLAVNFKDSCHRLWRILINDNQIFGSLTPYKCLRCREFTCTPACIEERTGSKVSIDIGGMYCSHIIMHDITNITSLLID